MSEDNITVLIVDDVAETRENVRKLLQFEKGVEVVGAASTGREAIEAARELKPLVVLMDINMPDMDGITATEAIRRTNSFTQVVILSVQGDPNYMRRAMLAGARDFLTKPPDVSELTSAIHRAGRMAREERSKTAAPAQAAGGASFGGLAPAASYGKVIAVYSPKGGSGCTTIAVNLAMTLQNGDSTVALIDGNLQFGDVAVFLNEQARNSVVDLAPRADELDPEVVEDVIITHKSSGVKFLAAPSRPEHAENVSGEQFGKVVQYLKRLYPYVVVDVSSHLTDVALSALDASDLIVLITTQDIPSIKNARLFLDLAEVLTIQRRRILFMMNRFDRRVGITPEKVGESFKHEISAVIPLDEKVIVPSVNRGIPFMMGDRARPTAKSFLSLTEEVRKRLAELSEAEMEEALQRA